VLPTSAESADLRIALDAAARGLAVAPLQAIEESADEALEAWDRALPADAFHLTAREREVLSLLAQGASNKEIARKLGISVHTAKFHVGSLLEKFDSTGRTDAVAQAVRLGILML
jgi:DNA-binding CsgD family transcriptional regulator